MGEVLEKAIEMALSGDRAMIKLLLTMHMSQNRHDDDETGGKSKVAVVIQNLGASPSNTSNDAGNIIEGEIING